ncbi:uncharacterized protein LOC127079397 [Lathyrus oleraceus]|uniref:uncharacterized protein LOC127079397 n=1 Tax=Pisum sativum TaxID=3888 RepID=UPI0021D0E7DC|nr:uncharacterized protein LOC127079397 [Pisum sativum]
MRSASSGSGWKVIVRCGLHNHKLSKDLEARDILGHLKVHEKHFVNDITKYNMTTRYIVAALKDKDPENLTNVTQMYGLPLLEIVGVKSTKLTFSVGFSYLEHEREEKFKWALKKLKELFSSKKFLPKVMVTDQELALMNVMEVMFPNLTHMLCLFHISKNVSMKCKEYVKSERHEHDMDLWNNIMYANRKTEFVAHLKHFETVCADIPLFVKYVSETWLRPYKERMKCAKWRLKNILTTSQEDLYQSWDTMNIMFKLQLGSIKCIQHIGKEQERVKFIGVSKYAYGCFIRTTHGLPYACQLAGFQIQGNHVPLDLIHVFWKKLHIEEHDVGHKANGTELDLEAECEELDTYFNTLDIIGKRVLRKKVRDLTYSSTTSMCPPPVKYKPKRGVKKSAITDLLGWGEGSWSLVQTQLDTQVHQHPKLFSNLFYETISEVMNALRV